MSKNQILDKTVQIMEKELKSVKSFQGQPGGAKALKGFLRGTDITESDIQEAKEAFNKVKMP